MGNYWYKGAVALQAANNNPTAVRSFYSKVVTPFDTVKLVGANVTGGAAGAGQHAVINGGRAAKAKKPQVAADLNAWKFFSNAGSWGSGHTGAMLGAFGDGRVQTITDTTTPNILCNLADRTSTVSTSL